jgi:hypothetical protein
MINGMMKPEATGIPFLSKTPSAIICDTNNEKIVAE